MYFRESFQKKTQQCATAGQKVEFFISRGDAKGAMEELKKLRAHLDDLESLIEREPMTGNEINKIR